ncbi:MAG: TolC family protein [Candidatus Xenobia bacterium]
MRNFKYWFHLVMIAGAVLCTCRAVDAQPLAPLPTPVPPASATPYTPPAVDLTPGPRANLPPPPAIPPDVPSRPLTVAEAVAIALRHQPSVGQAAANIQASSGHTEQVASAGRTTAALSGTYTGIDTVLNPTQQQGGGGGGALQAAQFGVRSNLGYSQTVAVRQLIFDFEHTRNLVRQAQSLESSAMATLTQTQNNLMLTVKQDFYTLQQDEALVKVDQANVADQQQHLAQAQAQYKAGVGLPLDVVQAQAAVAQAILNLKTAEVNADTARVTLLQAMGIDPRTPFVTAESKEPDPPTLDVNKLVDLAVAQRPETVGALLVVDADQHAINAAYSTNSPVLSATSDILSFPFGTGYEHEMTAGIQVDWPFADGGLTRGAVKQAKANLDSAVYQLQIAREGVLADVSSSYLQLTTAQQSLATAAVGVASADEQLRLAQGRYKAGLGIALDVLDAEAALLQAQTTQVNAQFAVEQAKAALNHAIAVPVPPVAPLPPVPVPIPAVPNGTRILMPGGWPPSAGYPTAAPSPSPTSGRK